MFRFFRLFVFVLLIALLLGALLMPVMAQDTPTGEEPTAAATEAPTLESTIAPTVEPTLAATDVPTIAPTEAPPIVDDEVSFRVGAWGFATVVIMLLLSGGGIGYVWGHVQGSKQAKDGLEQAYESLSPDAQDKISQAYDQAQGAWNRVDELARQVLKFVGEVTDKQPNVETAVAQGRDPLRPPYKITD